MKEQRVFKMLTVESRNKLLRGTRDDGNKCLDRAYLIRRIVATADRQYSSAGHHDEG